MTTEEASIIKPLVFSRRDYAYWRDEMEAAYIKSTSIGYGTS